MYTCYYSPYVGEQRHSFDCFKNGRARALGAKDTFAIVA